MVRIRIRVGVNSSIKMVGYNVQWAILSSGLTSYHQQLHMGDQHRMRGIWYWRRMQNSYWDDGVGQGGM